MTVLAHCEEMRGEVDEMVAMSQPRDTSLFARQDYIEEAWRILDPGLAKCTPVYPYDTGTWGPDEVARVSPAGGWKNPTVRAMTLGADGKAA